MDQQSFTAAPQLEEKNIISRFGVNLVELAKLGKLDPVIGRDEEIRRVIQVLSRRTKNNPVLIGEPGTGKTSIAEGLAQRITANDIPESLKQKEIIQIEIGAMLAGAAYRGQFEQRIKQLLIEVQKSAGRYILFLDELHTLVGAGSTEGSVSAANMFKPALARGDIRVIGATTLKEYQQHIERDPALERRFQTVFIAEPSADDSVAILRGIKHKYELYHGVKITDEAIVAAVELSRRYITDRFLPDKAIDLIDEATAGRRIELDSLPTELDELKRSLMKLEIEREALKKEPAAQKSLARIDQQLKELKRQWSEKESVWLKERTLINKIREINREIDRLNFEMQAREREGDLQKVAEIKYATVPNLEKDRLKIQDQLDQVQKQSSFLKDQVVKEDIARVVARWTGIPVASMLQTEQERLLKLEKILAKRVIGQDHALHSIASAIRRSRTGLAEENRPIGSFIFLGPSGVGKTETVKTLAETLFDNDQAMIRLDMSEYMERHAVARMVGAPPGYIGYEEGGQLTEKIRRRPYSVILLDEIEKAHPEVYNMLLQILDEGRLTDGKGRTVNFNNTVIIMTSNLGTDIIEKDRVGFKAHPNVSQENVKNKLLEVLRNYFRPEFLNRVDEVVIFKPLTSLNIQSIVELQLQKVTDRLANKYITIEYTSNLIKWLAKRGFDPKFGARPLKRLIEKEVLNKLAKEILAGHIQTGATVQVKVKNDTVVISSVLPQRF